MISWCPLCPPQCQRDWLSTLAQLPQSICLLMLGLVEHGCTSGRPATSYTTNSLCSCRCHCRATSTHNRLWDTRQAVTHSEQCVQMVCDRVSACFDMFVGTLGYRIKPGSLKFSPTVYISYPDLKKGHDLLGVKGQDNFFWYKMEVGKGNCHFNVPVFGKTDTKKMFPG